MGTRDKRHLGIVFGIAFSVLFLASVGSQEASAGLPPVDHHTITTPTGGECSKIGTWNAGTSTCTLTRDLVDETIDVKSDGVTIDGNNHSSTGPFVVIDPDEFEGECEYWGVQFSGISGGTVKDLEISGWQNGVEIDGSDTTRVQNVNSHNNCNDGIHVHGNSFKITITGGTFNNNGEDGDGDGIDIEDNDGDAVDDANTITNNIANSNEDTGIEIDDSDKNTITGNTASGNEDKGIDYENSNDGTISGNTANSNGDHGIHIDDSGSNTITKNTVNFNGVQEGADGINLDDSNKNTISGNTAMFNTDDGIELDSSNGNKLTDNTANENDQNGILLESSLSNTLTDNTANNNDNDCVGECEEANGILLTDGSDENTLTGNEANGNEQNGIRVENSDDNTLEKNKVSGNGDDGIELSDAHDNTLKGNTANGNGLDGSDEGIDLNDGSSNNELTENTANGNTGNGIELEASGGSIGVNTDAGASDDCVDGNTLTGNTANENTDNGYRLDDSDCNTFKNNVAKNNVDDGFDIDNSDFNLFEGNTATGNEDGFALKGTSSNNVFTCNIASFNDEAGIQIQDDANSNIFDGNTLESNVEWGLDIRSGETPTKNSVQDNNFISNTPGQILDNGISTFIDSNYYDTYDEFGEGCTDNDVDGFCDAALAIKNNGVGDENARTKQTQCDETKPPMNACLTTAGVQSFENDPFVHIGIVSPGSMELDNIGEPEVFPAIVYGIVRTSDGQLIVSGDSEGGPYISPVNPITGELEIPPFVGTFIVVEGSSQDLLLTDLAIQPGTGVIYGITDDDSFGDDGILNQRLFTVDPETGKVFDEGPLFLEAKVIYDPRGIGFGPDGKLYAIVELRDADKIQVMLEIEFDGDDFTVMRTMDIADTPRVDGFLVCPDGSFMYTGQIPSSSEIGLIDPVTGFLIMTSTTEETLGDLSFRPSAATSSGAGGHEPPTIGKALDGVRQVVDGGISIDAQTWTVTQPYHQEFELLQMLSSPHTISNVIHCDKGVEYCNYIAVGFMGLDDNFNNPVMTVSASKDHQGTWTLNWFDPDDFISDPGDAVPADIVFVPQIIDNNLLGTSFTIDFKNKDTGQLKMGIQVRDSYNGVRNFYFNEGVEFIDADAYPAVESSYDAPIEVEPVCFGQNNPDRHSCAFAKIKDWTTANAEETLRQMMGNQYEYDQ